jgi:hypothetical protein
LIKLIKSPDGTLSYLGNQLEAFAAAVNFEVFRPELDRVLAYSDGGGFFHFRE